MRHYLVFLFLILLVLIRFFTSTPKYKEGQRLRISGVVSVEPTVYPNRQSILVSGLRIFLPSFPEVHYGDRVELEGVYEKGIVNGQRIIHLSDTNNILIVLKKNLVSFWQNNLPEPHASLVAGIVLGYKSSLPRDFVSDLRRTGTSHVVVASGMNVTFVSSFILSILILFMTRRKAIYFTALGIIVYCVITGFEAPIVRAVVMTLVTLIAVASGRITRAFEVLFLTALVMLVIKPLWLTDLGFILSFSATLSLMLFEKKIHTFIRFVPGIFRESLSTSLAAQVLVAPIIYIAFGQISLLSPIVNALVLWIVPIVMIVGSVGGLVGLIIPGLGKLIIFLVYPLTSWFIWITHFFAKI